jgi:hypothetical protein
MELGAENYDKTNDRRSELEITILGRLAGSESCRMGRRNSSGEDA